MAARIRALVVLVAATCGCFGIRHTTTEGDRPDDRRTRTEVKLSLDPNENRLSEGRDAASRGEYQAALEAFDAVYRNSDAKPELRAQALYQTALVQSNTLNPRRDTAAATTTARKLLTEFPESEWRDDAQQLIETLESTPAH